MKPTDSIGPFPPPPSPRPGDLGPPAEGYERAAPGSARAVAVSLPCGSCSTPQPTGTAACSECGFNPAWIVEPCPECQGRPANVSAPVGQSDFSGGGCRNCDGGWVETSGATARVIAWRLAFDRSGSGKTARTTPVEILRELTEAGDRWLPGPAAEYDRRQALRVQAFLGPSGKSGAARPLLDHRGEVAGREIGERELILFEDDDAHPPGRLIAVGDPQRFVRELPGTAGLVTLTEEPERATAYDSRETAEAKAADFRKWPLCEGMAIGVAPGPFDVDSIRRLLGEAVEILESQEMALPWCMMARPFARFPEDAK